MLLRTAGQGTLRPIWQQLHDLRLPVMAIAGALDERYSKVAERIARAVPDGVAHLVETAGHAPQLQRPEIVCGLLADFLDQHLGQGVV